MRALATLLLLGCWACPAAARVSVTETLRIYWMVDNENGRDGDDDYGLLQSRLDLRGADGDLTTHARVDGFFYVDDHGDWRGPGAAQDEGLELERLTARYDLGDWTLEVGDQHTQLGRGIVLSLRPVEAAGIDVALRGGQVAYDDGTQRAALFAGRTNPINFDVLSYKRVDDVADEMIGGSYALSLDGLPTVTAFGVYVAPEVPILEGETDDAKSVGLSVDAPGLWDWLSIYAEVDYQRRRLIGEEDTGKAAYATVDLTFGETQVLLEGLMLDAWEQKGSNNSALSSRFDYNRPPNLERIDQEVLDNRDVRGGRVRLERPLFTPDVIGHVNGMYRVQKPGEEAEVRQVHAYAGAEIYFSGRLAFSGGWRDEVDDDDETIKGMKHLELELDHPLWGMDLHVSSLTEFREVGGVDHERGSTIVGLDKAGLGGLSFELGHDNQNSADDVRQIFFAGLLRWSASANHDLRLAAGTQRGGIKCVSGVCREYPAFAGTRLEWIGRF